MRDTSDTRTSQPSAEQAERATITRFAGWLQDRVDDDVLESYEALWQWSVADVGRFWAMVWAFFDVRADGSAAPVLTDASMPGVRWFPEARLNYAEHVFRDRDPTALAIQFASESDDGVETWTWGELESQTSRVAAGLRRLGVGRGDRVAAYLPNVPETIAAFLACASLGAIWSAAAPEFGVSTVLERFAQIEPKVLLATDGYRYGGKSFDRREAVAGLMRNLPSVTHLVLLNRLDAGPLVDCVRWDDLPETDEPLKFARVPFDHPLWVLYSSGTTGPPKPIVHGHGGDASRASEGGEPSHRRSGR